ncbi:hypothetical protein EN871_09080 [bacterium M00.F.Ca.ET.228.01.1.1]|nr:hypothetical protein EN871_09080 [bacterium M00.F.Ca.ET.228.01.1.1]TGS02617.1 hypothetical protein EN834_09075 [bacterium M00.F.Ca.ET.191.01.1.1]TGU05999.1 hypothetical protein EN798_13155 [bacterium M00.F.Ca.ET.155.01.1.1]
MKQRPHPGTTILFCAIKENPRRKNCRVRREAAGAGAGGKRCAKEGALRRELRRKQALNRRIKQKFNRPLPGSAGQWRSRRAVAPSQQQGNGPSIGPYAISAACPQSRCVRLGKLLKNYSRTSPST